MWVWHYMYRKYYPQLLLITVLLTAIETQLLISAPSLGVYYFLSLTLSVCGSVTPLQNASSFLFLDGIEPFLTVSSPWHPLQNVVLRFLAHDSMLSALYAIARPSVRLSVCLSVTRVDQSKTVERIIEILSPSDRPNILVFRHQRSLCNSDGFTPNGGAKYKGGNKN